MMIRDYKKGFICGLFIAAYLIIGNPTSMLSQESLDYGISHYDLEIEVFPAKRSISSKTILSVKGIAEQTNRIRLFLHRDFSVQSVMSSGQSLAFSKPGKVENRPMFSPTAAAFDIVLSQNLKRTKRNRSNSSIRERSKKSLIMSI